jgi:hypothetical protein
VRSGMMRLGLSHRDSSVTEKIGPNCANFRKIRIKFRKFLGPRAYQNIPAGFPASWDQSIECVFVSLTLNYHIKSPERAR